MSGSHSTGVTPVGVATILLRRRRTIVGTTALGVALAVGLALFRAPHWTATFSVMPQAGADGAPGGLASLAGQFGVSIGGMTGGGQPPQFYADVLHTREILLAVQTDSVEMAGRRIPLAEALRVEAETPELLAARVVRKLRDDVVSATVASRTTGVVAVRVRTRDPDVSRQLAERLLARLNAFDVETRRTQAAAERRFVEEQHASAADSLRRIEERLQGFLVDNRDYESSPRLSFQYERLVRALSAQQGVVSGLDQAVREARIREVRDTPVLTTVDPPRQPVEPDPRGRLMLLLGGIAGGIAAGLVLALLLDAVHRAGSEGDPEVEALRHEWRRLRGRG